MSEVGERKPLVQSPFVDDGGEFPVCSYQEGEVGSPDHFKCDKQALYKCQVRILWRKNIGC